MKLIYRATTYNYNPAKAPGRPFQQFRESKPAYKLMYRGMNINHCSPFNRTSH